VVADLRNGGIRTIESTGRGFSRPALIDGVLLVKEIFDDRYVIGRLAWNDFKIVPLVEVNDSAISATEITEIKIENAKP
jgi:hypothetical protein